jgi:hypothetical protein
MSLENESRLVGGIINIIIGAFVLMLIIAAAVA